MELLYIALLAGACWLSWRAGKTQGMTEAHTAARQQLDRDKRELHEAFVCGKAQTLDTFPYLNYGRTDADTPPLVLIHASSLINVVAQDAATSDVPDGSRADKDAAYDRRWEQFLSEWLNAHRALSEQDRMRIREQMIP